MANLESGQPAKAEGLEEKAANVLNCVMVILLGGAVVGFSVWSVWDFATAFLAGNPPERWQSDLIIRFLVPLAVIWQGSEFAWSAFRKLRARSSRR